MGDSVLIFGASVRAAAFSALRAGLAPWCADLFADADLSARCPALRLAGKYPNGFLDLINRAPPGPWLYTGGLENHPDLVEELSRRRPLWGNAGRVLLRVRMPTFLARISHFAGLPAPAVSRQVRQPPGPGPWLIKPLGGAGGAGITFWSEAAAARLYRVSYVQEFIEGEPAAALYLGADGGARLLGMTRQLIGQDWLGAEGFQYCGSIGPLPPLPDVWRPLERLGERLVQEGGLRGLFGVDGVLRDGTFWPVEVNPRYTASVEVLEYATGLPALCLHRLAFEATAEALRHPLPEAQTGVVGKAILFAREAVTFPADGPWIETLRSPGVIANMPGFADLPHPGDRIDKGRPVLTLFARGADERACEAELRRRAEEVAGQAGIWPRRE